MNKTNTYYTSEEAEDNIRNKFLDIWAPDYTTATIKHFPEFRMWCIMVQNQVTHRCYYERAGYKPIRAIDW